MPVVGCRLPKSNVWKSGPGRRVRPCRPGGRWSSGRCRRARLRPADRPVRVERDFHKAHQPMCRRAADRAGAAPLMLHQRRKIPPVVGHQHVAVRERAAHRESVLARPQPEPGDVRGLRRREQDRPPAGVRDRPAGFLRRLCGTPPAASLSDAMRRRRRIEPSARVASTKLVERAAMPNPSVILGPEDCLRHGAVRSSASHRVLPSPPAAGCCKDTRPKTPRCCRVTKAGRSNRKKGGCRHRPRRDGHLSSAHPSSHPVPCGRAGRRPSGSRGGPEGNRRICDGGRRAAADRTILDSIRRSREPGSIGVWTSDRNCADTLRPLGAAVNSGERVDITAW